MQRLREEGPALRLDHADEAGRQGAGRFRLGGAEHRGLRLAPGKRGAGVHRQRTGLDGRRSAARRAEPRPAKGAPFRVPLLPRGYPGSLLREEPGLRGVHGPGDQAGPPRGRAGDEVLHGEPVPRNTATRCSSRARIVEPQQTDRYRITWCASMAAGRRYETFAEGWSRESRRGGRPVEVLLMPRRPPCSSPTTAGAI